MRAFALVTGLLSLTAAVHGRSTISRVRSAVMESLHAVPEGWKAIGVPDPDTRMAFRIAIKEPNPGLFEQTLYEISTPGSPKYGQHLKREELKDLIRPSKEATDSVIDWLTTSGIQADEIEDDGEWISFIATINQAEAILKSQFKTYASTVREGVSKIRTLEYSVPEKLHQYVRMIQPTTRFGQLRPQFNSVHRIEKVEDVPGALSAQSLVDDVAAAVCNTTITPACLRSLYKVGNFQANPKNGFVGVTGYLDQLARFTDLAQFETLYAQNAINQSFTVTSINGGTTDQLGTSDSVEASLDIQYTVGLSAPIPQKFYSTGGRGILVPDLDQPNPEDNQNEPYMEFLKYLSALPDKDLPSVLTTSYGEDEQSVPKEYAKTVCDMYGHLGARGVSVLHSSGDTGVGSACQTNDGKNTTRFLPIFPAACPYVTAVGGTTQVEPEVAIGFSSGGFSDIFPRPSYQDSAVKGYLSILGDRWKGLYNPTGRGFPDLAAQSNRFHVIDKGLDILVGGTSASCPAVAGIIADLNSARIDAGKPKLGFLNPWIYSGGKEGFTDIVNGGSTGCTGRDIYSGLPTPFVPYASWNATKGWDPVTGLGTPLFDVLKEKSCGK
ncbi:tripeptidyl-peptidase-like protein [Pseudovirgaria hyperparasitica]|uniref:tripeptidyl-peptidase II n=1 Tax=Pseudovirgaria hyperparasitica TaxID=470096 RepID=A0A6A6W8J7_9PEZI|nr:tripeptidyl-peptidase-like protein [Pseudovirgaria hyperparasitica]KAF2758354.1 tripeptidyl-peptidase-like protein [Pseudovirgaria hyperparasitica]